ncbi:DUF3995 domain-containing protein [Modestobacter altitudinis]|uniref:DUF3995 domain-containing protein n=1 Tax=Modestobacter altitudinis TaxID=2213158 RepID=UPI0014863ACA|nr:DUF3995 domain-containing protein [Modestobacter altitudinis]
MSATARAAAGTAAGLALASAAVTAWWTAGGTALLDTVGGAFESLAEDRSAPAVLLGLGVVAAKLVAAVLALALLRRTPRGVRLLALLAGLLLTLWGAANVILGGAVLTGLLDLGPVADERALRWHVFCWDAWFLVWGVALLVAVRLTSSRSGQWGGAVVPRSSSTGSTSSARRPG